MRLALGGRIGTALLGYCSLTLQLSEILCDIFVLQLEVVPQLPKSFV